MPTQKCSTQIQIRLAEYPTAGLPMSYKLGPRWNAVITKFDFKSEAIFGFLSRNYMEQCT